MTNELGHHQPSLALRDRLPQAQPPRLLDLLALEKESDKNIIISYLVGADAVEASNSKGATATAASK